MGGWVVLTETGVRGLFFPPPASLKVYPGYFECQYDAAMHMYIDPSIY